MTKLEQDMHLEQQLKDVVAQNKSIEGIMCVSNKGLCLSKKGKVPEYLAGPISVLCNIAKDKWIDEKPPEIILTFNNGGSTSSSKSILMKLKDDVCTAVMTKKT